MGLTPMQERFALEVASGKSQTAAYRIAYKDSARWKDSTIWNRASALMRENEVFARVAELRAEMVKDAIWKREDSARAMIAVVENPDNKPSDVVAAVKVLNEMHGYNSPQKFEHSGTINWPVPAPKVEG